MARPRTDNPAPSTIRRWRHEERKGASFGVYSINVHEEQFNTLVRERYLDGWDNDELSDARKRAIARQDALNEWVAANLPYTPQ